RGPRPASVAGGARVARLLAPRGGRRAPAVRGYWWRRPVNPRLQVAEDDSGVAGHARVGRADDLDGDAVTAGARLDLSDGGTGVAAEVADRDGLLRPRWQQDRGRAVEDAVADAVVFQRPAVRVA